MDLKSYITKNRKRYLKDLFEILSIPSISTLSENKKDVIHCSKWLVDYFHKIGIENTKIFETKGNPIVYANYGNLVGKPTVLIYGHYDVQPADPISEWKSDPFIPIIKDGKLYARGAADDKCQFMLYLFAVSYFLESGLELPINVKFLIEGEEEVGGENLADFIVEHKDLLDSDYALISDSHMFAEDKPAIDYGLRGLVYFQIDITTARQDVHSGIYGGVVQNPINVLAYIISKMKDENGKILIPGIYDNVRKIDLLEREMIQSHLTDNQIISETGAIKPFGEKEYLLAERVGARPSLDVHGIWGGFSGEGSKTIIPASSGCKVSIRIVPNQTVQEVKEKFIGYLDNITPEGVLIKVTFLTGGEAYLLDYRKPVMQKASKVLAKVFGNSPSFLLSGGSIPVTETVKTNLGIDSVLMGFGLPDDNLHGPNEKMNLNQIFKGIETIVRYFIELGS